MNNTTHAQELAEALRRLLEEEDDVNGWRPTALQPGGVAYENARAVLRRWDARQRHQSGRKARK